MLENDFDKLRLPVSVANRQGGNARAKTRNRAAASAVRGFSGEIRQIMDAFIREMAAALVTTPQAASRVFETHLRELINTRVTIYARGEAFGRKLADVQKPVEINTPVEVEVKDAGTTNFKAPPSEDNLIGDIGNWRKKIISDRRLKQRKTKGSFSGIEKAFPVRLPTLRELVTRTAGSVFSWLRIMSETSLKRLSDSLLEYRDELIANIQTEQLTMPEVIERLIERGVATTRADAERMAHTDYMFAANEGEMAEYREAGFELLQWILTDDDLLCPFCEGFDGAVVENGVAFATGGETLGVTDTINGRHYSMTPRSDIYHPPLHPNCRCTMRPIRGKLRDNSVIEPVSE